MQDVVLHQLVVLSGVIMIEYGFRLFVLKEFQRNECKRLPAIRTLIRRKGASASPFRGKPVSGWQ